MLTSGKREWAVGSVVLGGGQRLLLSMICGTGCSHHHDEMKEKNLAPLVCTGCAIKSFVYWLIGLAIPAAVT